MDASTVALVALGLTLIVQSLGIGIAYGVLITKVSAIEKEQIKHEAMSAERAHETERRTR